MSAQETDHRAPESVCDWAVQRGLVCAAGTWRRLLLHREDRTPAGKVAIDKTSLLEADAVRCWDAWTWALRV